MTKITPEKKDMLLKSLHTKAFLRDKMNELQAQLDELTSTFVGNRGKVYIQNVVHCGVDVLIGDAKMHVKDEIPCCVLSNDDGRVVVGPFIP